MRCSRPTTAARPSPASRKRRPGLILLDLMMPEMDGFEFLSALRRGEAWRGIPVVVVTAKDLTPEERQRLNGHVERILAKGALGPEALLAEVRELVAAPRSAAVRGGPPRWPRRSCWSRTTR